MSVSLWEFEKPQFLPLLIGEPNDEWPVDDPPTIGAGAEPNVPGLDDVQSEPPVQHLDSVAPGAAAGGDHPAAPAEPDSRRRHHVSKERRPREGQEQKEVEDQEPA